MDLFADDAPIEVSAPKAVNKPELPCSRCHATYLSDFEVAERYSVARSAIWRWVKSNPAFPNPIKLSPGTTRWVLSDLVRFERQKERDATTRRKAKLAGTPQ